MKKLILFTSLLFLPFISIGQIIVDKKLGEIDIRNFNDKYITIQLDHILPSSHILTTSEYKKIVMKIGNKPNVYDNSALIRLKSKIDILNFFSKYGYELVSEDVDYGVVVNNVLINQNSLTLKRIKKE
ncbi:MAG: hypothetical protein HON09_04045 [Flavobacteriaceae bacterium]|nr:hypothetical protein [Flavobacteriaceae bacterium]